MPEGNKTGQPHLPFFGWMPAQKYLEHPAISSSFIARFLRSPAHAKFARQKQTNSMQVGSAVHCAVLEPHCFEKRYGVYAGARNDKHEAYQDWKLEHPGVEAILQADYDKARVMADAVHDDPSIAYLLRDGQAERTAIATVDGIDCKARPDWLTTIDGELIHVSLKTTEDARKWSFGATALKYQYHVAEFFYSLVLEASGKPVTQSFVIAIERDYPHCTMLYELDKPAKMLADDQLCKAWNGIKRCINDGEWPGYSRGAQQLSLPGYAFTEINQ